VWHWTRCRNWSGFIFYFSSWFSSPVSYQLMMKVWYWQCQSSQEMFLVCCFGRDFQGLSETQNWKNFRMDFCIEIDKCLTCNRLGFPGNTISASKCLKHGEDFIVYKETFLCHFGNISMLAAKKVWSGWRLQQMVNGLLNWSLTEAG